MPTDEPRMEIRVRASLAFDSCLFVSIRGLIILLRDLRDEVLKNLSDLYF